jgi:hypothetical protein
VKTEGQKGKGFLEILKLRWEDNIKMDVQEMG